MIFLCVPIFTAVSLNLLSSECNILVLVTINIAQLIVILRCVTFGAETREWKGLDCETLAGFHVSATSFFFIFKIRFDDVSETSSGNSWARQFGTNLSLLNHVQVNRKSHVIGSNN